MSHGVTYKPRGREAFEVTLATEQGSLITVAGSAEGSEPEITGDKALQDNPALASLLWALGVHEWQYRRLRSEEVRKSHRKEADRCEAEAQVLARMIDHVGRDKRRIVRAWCSACFSRANLVRVDGFDRPMTTYLCSSCGSAINSCAAPTCSNMATRRLTKFSSPRYCAEHRHDIPSFEKLGERLDTIEDYKSWLEFEKMNLARVSRIAAVAALAGLAITPAAFVAAPVIGGAVGAATGLTGAAATSHGLAVLGGGALAAGGLGMAGGTAVVTVLGAGLGSVMGGVATSSYVRSDDSFKIEKLRDGHGSVVLLANGFLTQGRHSGWGGWRRIVDECYPENPVYRVHWGSKELRDLAVLAGGALGNQAAKQAVMQLAMRASKKAALPVLGSLLGLGGLASNPWMVAKNRATMTGVILADLIARTDDQSYVLLGHSLGAKVMVTAAQSLGTRAGSPKIEAMHLLGAAVAADGDWQTLVDAVDERIYNYYSERDSVLKYLYRFAQAGHQAAGSAGMKSKRRKISNRRVSAAVPTHAAYFDQVRLVCP